MTGADRNEGAGGGVEAGTNLDFAAMLRLVSEQPAWVRALGAIVTLAAVAVAIVVLRRLLSHVSPSAVAAVFSTLDAHAILLAVAGAAGSYGALTFYDVLALRVIGRPLGWPTAASAAFPAYAFSHNLGFGAVTGGGARYRVYSRAGLASADVARVIVLTGATFALGVAAVAGVALLRDPAMLGVSGIMLPRWLEQGVGALILAALAAAILLPRGDVSELRFRRWSIPLPSRRSLALQLLVSAIDISCAGLCLFALLPHLHLALYPAFMLAYALALVAGIVSHVPGGLGVFEAVMLAALPEVAPAELVAGLIAYRAIYYWVPLLLGSGLFAAMEARAARSAG